MFGGKIENHLISFFRKAKNIMNREAHQYGIQASEVRILDILYKEGTLSQDAFTSRLFADRTTISRRIKKLELLGYVKKEKNSKDNRTYELYLTEEGKYVARKVLYIRENITQIVKNSISEEEFMLLAKILEKADNGLDEQQYLKCKLERENE
ncbi:MarR family winged helix-turn-helix transcriptional regulator [Anaeromicrobium sediminis]|nr:MarR family transcriptional regulator [Anaeromicrobium sediminis]